MIVITLSKVAAIKFLTEEGLACEIEDDPWYNVESLPFPESCTTIFKLALKFF